MGNTGSLLPVESFELSKYMGDWYQLASNRGESVKYTFQPHGETIRVTMSFSIRNKKVVHHGSLLSSTDPSKCQLHLQQVFLGFSSKYKHEIRKVLHQRGRYRFVWLDGPRGIILLGRKLSTSLSTQEYLRQISESLGSKLIFSSSLST